MSDTIPSSGKILLGDLRNVFSTGSGPKKLKSYYKGGNQVASTTLNNSIPTSGRIRLSDFYGKGNPVRVGGGTGVLPGNWSEYPNAWFAIDSYIPSASARNSNSQLVITWAMVSPTSGTGSQNMTLELRDSSDNSAISPSYQRTSRVSGSISQRQYHHVCIATFPIGTKTCDLRYVLSHNFPDFWVAATFTVINNSQTLNSLAVVDESSFSNKVRGSENSYSINLDMVPGSFAAIALTAVGNEQFAFPNTFVSSYQYNINNQNISGVPSRLSNCIDNHKITDRVGHLVQYTRYINTAKAQVTAIENRTATVTFSDSFIDSTTSSNGFSIIMGTSFQC